MEPMFGEFLVSTIRNFFFAMRKSACSCNVRERAVFSALAAFPALASWHFRRLPMTHGISADRDVLLRLRNSKWRPISGARGAH